MVFIMALLKAAIKRITQLKYFDFFKIKEALESIGYKFKTLDIENYCIGGKYGIDLCIRARLKDKESGQELS